MVTNNEVFGNEDPSTEAKRRPKIKIANGLRMDRNVRKKV